MNLGENLKRARRSAGMTQADVAQAIGVYPKDISRWESNDRVPSTETFAKICKVIGASADEILELQTRPAFLASGRGTAIPGAGRVNLPPICHRNI